MLMPFVSTLPVKAAASAASSAVVTADMLAPISTTLEANLAVLVPVGIGIMGAMIGVSLIPRIVYKFL